MQPDGQASQLQTRRPSLGAFEQNRNLLVLHHPAGHSVQHLRGRAEVEREILPAEFDQFIARAQVAQRHRQFGPAGEHNVHVRRRDGNQGLQVCQQPMVGHQVQVIEDHNEVVRVGELNAQRIDQRLAESASAEQSKGSEFVDTCDQTIEFGQQPADEMDGVVVVRSDVDPRRAQTWPGPSPLRQQNGLARTCLCDHQANACVQHRIQPRAQLRPVDCARGDELATSH